MEFSTGCHGDMQMKLKTLSSFSENLQYNRGTKCRWKDITTQAKMTWKQVQINVTRNTSAKRNGIMKWSVWSRIIQVALMKKTYFKWIFDRDTIIDQEKNKGKDILFRKHGKTSGEERVRRKVQLLKDKKVVPKYKHSPLILFRVKPSWSNTYFPFHGG